MDFHSLYLKEKRKGSYIPDPLSANLTKWSTTQTICRQKLTNCWSLFNHFVGLALKGLTICKLIHFSPTGMQPEQFGDRYTGLAWAPKTCVQNIL